MGKRIEGLGDVVDAITTATGIKAVTKAIFGKHCGCEERRDRLNELYPSSLKPKRWMSEAEAEAFGDVLANKRGGTLTSAQTHVVAKLHSDVFGHRFHVPCTCNAATWRMWFEDLEKLYNE
jgi:hypothetical protein